MARPTKKEEWRKAISEAVTKLTPEVVQKLKDAFAIGANMKQACSYAEISHQTYYNWINKNPDLLEAFEKMKESLPLKAKRNIAVAIEQSDLRTSIWLIERKEPDTYGETINVNQTDITEGMHPEDEKIRLEMKQKLIANIRRRAKEKNGNKE